MVMQNRSCCDYLVHVNSNQVKLEEAVGCGVLQLETKRALVCSLRMIYKFAVPEIKALCKPAWNQSRRHTTNKAFFQFALASFTTTSSTFTTSSTTSSTFTTSSTSFATTSIFASCAFTAFAHAFLWRQVFVGATTYAAMIWCWF